MEAWVDQMEPLAFGELALLPWEFGRLTPREFKLRLEGHGRTWERLAGLVAWVAQANYKAELTPEMMLHGKPGPPK